ncbi:arginine N-succinyltransferase [bacterium]|jgi:arginine N-succinyltransferase|nr:arginine N-succinyltransferase [bacterium]
MILLREIQEKDIEALERLAQIPGFINLTNDRDYLKELIGRSVSSFKDSLANKGEAKYIFVAEDLQNHRVLGTSMIAAQHGTADSPHFYFEVGSEEKFSDTINTGFIHGTLKLKYDTNGPSEIGGLVLDPEQRNSEARIGRQISFLRFLFLGLNKNRFKRKVIAELLPPLNKKGQSPLWEAVGRRFTNMDYWEADRLCQKNKEFIFSLFPSGKIYTTFLPAEARNAIGKVGKETEPVVHMLKKIGFTYKNQVDPFDGGPHLWANVDEILPIKKLAPFQFDPTLAVPAGSPKETGLICKTQQKPATFRAMSVQVVTQNGKITPVEPQAEALRQVLAIEPGDQVSFMPYY